jgi:hypothetical protein
MSTFLSSVVCVKMGRRAKHVSALRARSKMEIAVPRVFITVRSDQYIITELLHRTSTSTLSHQRSPLNDLYLLRDICLSSSNEPQAARYKSRIACPLIFLSLQNQRSCVSLSTMSL